MARERALALERTSNPALTKEVFTRAAQTTAAGEETMTIGGAVNRSAFLLLLLILAAVYVWMRFVGVENPPSLTPWILGGTLGGLVVALIIIFVKRSAPYLSPVYAVLEGLALGGISTLMESRFPGIVLQAVALTFGTLLVLLAAYKSGLIKATENFKLGVVAATGAIALIYIATMVLGIFGVNIPYIHESGIVGIIFSLVVVVIAALNLVLDFDFIETGAERGAPRYMEWYAAFGLLVTLVWLYLEILRLLSKIRSR
ncbi:MAG: Bax inhibitor-1/YccA family protein [Candidatus Zixiibacteriota bacterium]